MATEHAYVHPVNVFCGICHADCRLVVHSLELIFLLISSWNVCVSVFRTSRIWLLKFQEESLIPFPVSVKSLQTCCLIFYYKHSFLSRWDETCFGFCMWASRECRCIHIDWMGRLWVGDWEYQFAQFPLYDNVTGGRWDRGGGREGGK